MSPRRRRVGWVAGALTFGAFMAAAQVCAAAVKVQLLVVGNNNAFGGAGPTLPTLQFADDDAAAVYDLLQEIADTAHLLTVMDAETQALYPGLAAQARPPTLAELRTAVADIRRRIEENRRHGDSNVLYVFFSGHGSISEGDAPALALLDGGISHEVLYDEILGQLPADYVHLFVDACHAEAVVRPRDSQAQAVRVAPADASAFLVRSTLARFPHVGAVVAASSDAQAHEWDQLGHGVFTHELLSALRGAADVNRDGRIEYSELYAFLAAANRGVDDARARLSVVARPPEVDRHVVILDLTHFPTARMARLRDIPARAGLVEVEDGAGRRLASLRGEPGFVADLILPAGTVYVRAHDAEARLDSRPGDSVTFDGLRFQSPRSRARGALEDAVRRGLYAGEYGQGYYRGFIDQSADFVPVSFTAAETVRGGATPPAVADAGDRRVAGGSQLLAGVGATTAVASAFTASEAIRIGLRPGGRHGLALSVDLTRAAQAGIAEWHGVATAGWMWTARLGPARGWAGAVGGGGAIAQTASGQSARWSAALVAGPVLGAAADVNRRFGFWAEAQLLGLAYRAEARTALSGSPGLFVGAFFAL
jgi:hypothetical protein